MYFTSPINLKIDKEYQFVDGVMTVMEKDYNRIKKILKKIDSKVEIRDYKGAIVNKKEQKNDSKRIQKRKKTKN